MLEKLKDKYILIKVQMAFKLMFYDAYKGSFTTGKIEASRAANSFKPLGYEVKFIPKGLVLGIEIWRII